MSVGADVGALVGMGDGTVVGTGVGTAVGMGDGSGVGTAAGAPGGQIVASTSDPLKNLLRRMAGAAERVGFLFHGPLSCTMYNLATPVRFDSPYFPVEKREP